MCFNFGLKFFSEVCDIICNGDGIWCVVYKNFKDGSIIEIDVKFVFIGVGGGVLKLL